jgi:hypothetical protein
MLLNKINVLDKGFVTLIGSSGNGKLLQDLQETYFKTKINMKLLDICSATLIIKCPLFVQLNLAQFGFDIISTPSDNVEAYLPDVGAIQASSLEESQRIANYITATTEALLLNHKGFSMDGADKFTAQMLTPINVYNEVIICGNLKNWISYLKQSVVPEPLKAYQRAVEEVLTTEWKNLAQLQKILK